MPKKKSKRKQRQEPPPTRGGELQKMLRRGFAQYQAGGLDEAEAVYKKVLRVAPQNAEALNRLGLIAYRRGQYETAAATIRKAVAAEPGLASAHNNLGNALCQLGDRSGAEASYRRALELESAFFDAAFNLGCLQYQDGRIAEAGESFRRASAIDPESAPAHNNLGLALADLEQRQEAVAQYRKALEIAPDYADALVNSGVVLEQMGELEKSASFFRRALGLGTEHAAMAKFRLATILTQLGDVQNAISVYREALQEDRSFAAAHSKILFALHYVAGLRPDILYNAHREWNAWHAAPVEPAPLPAPAEPEKRPLRVGLVSLSFRSHPAMWLSIAGLEALDPSRVQLYAYAHMPTSKEDGFTERLKRICHAWRPIAHLDDAEAAAQIRADGVDVLIDMSGHSESRMLVCAHRAAPLQVKWVGGQFNTTGMDAMDWMIADAAEIPPGEEKWYTEKIYRMPDGYVVYEPPDYAPEVGPLPARENGFVTFGCFNNPAKINEQILLLWARVLEAVPNSRLYLKGKAFGFDSAVRRVRDMAAAGGIDPERVIFEGQSPHKELLACYNGVDIALDPWPYSGGLTTCEALWMGAPVLTVPGPSFAGRHAASHLTNAGLTDWIVDSPDAYVETAIAWARDLDALAATRASLRRQVAASPLCDGPRFARNFENALQEIWREACAAGRGAPAEAAASMGA